MKTSRPRLQAALSFTVYAACMFALVFVVPFLPDAHWATRIAPGIAGVALLAGYNGVRLVRKHGYLGGARR